MANCICPKCSSKNIIPIIYRHPDSETIKASEEGKIHLGGCIIYIDGCKMPDKYCKDCKHEWSVDQFVSEDIVKVRFRYWSNWGYYEPESENAEQWAFEVFPDGTVKYFAYPRGSRRVLDKDVVHISLEGVNDFYNQVIWLYRPWTEIIDCHICDGCSYELTITYKDNRKRRLTGDLGGGTIDKTVLNFLYTIPKMRAKIEGGIDDE